MPENKEKNKNLKRLTAGLLIGLSVTVITALLILINPFNNWHLTLSNSLYTKDEPSDDIVIVAIDEDSTKPKTQGGLGKFRTWSRQYYADVINKLKKEDAKAILLDINFMDESSGLNSESLQTLYSNLKNISGNEQKVEFINKELEKYVNTENHPADVALADAIKEFTNVVLYSLTNRDVHTGEHTFKADAAIFPIALLNINPSLKNNLGLMEGEIDDDNVLRRLISGVTVEDSILADNGRTKYIESASIALARMVFGSEIPNNPQVENDHYIIEASGKRIQIPLEDGKFLINYFAKPYGYQMVPFSDVYYAEDLNGRFKNKIVLIGATAKILQDFSFTPNSTETQMPNIEIHANAVQTILDEKFLQNQSLLSQIATAAAISILGSLALVFMNIWFGIAFALILALLYYFGFAPLMYRSGTIVNMIYPLIAVVLIFFGSIIYKYFAELRQKRYIKNAFGKYLSGDVLNEVLKDPNMLHRHGVKREVTVFFTDIAGFASIAEKITREQSPEVLLELVNDYLGVMTEIVMSHKGTLDKYVGDAIVGYFGAPVKHSDHALKACKVALEMRRKLPPLKAKWKKKADVLIDFRVGINTGEVIIGNVGAEERFDYTMMGDEVNLGSRLEGANKKYKTNIMISESTYDQVRDYFIARRLDILRVKGKDNPVQVYELLGEKGSIGEKGMQLLEHYNKGMDLYMSRDFKAACGEFKKALDIYPKDDPSKVYLQRCDVLSDFPPPKDWDGVFTMKSK